MPDITPLSEELDARRVVNGDVLQYISSTNIMLGSQYDESVRQWIANKQQLPAGSTLPQIPVPPLSWVAVPVIYTPTQKAYDAAYPGIEPLITAVQTGPPVRQQYVEPGAPTPLPPGHFDIGPFLRTETRTINGQTLEVKLYEAMPDDTEPAGKMRPAPDGTIVHKVIHITPFGTVGWYEGV